MSFANAGTVWNLAEFGAHLRSVARPAWVDAVTLHHTAAPSLAQRPHGINRQHSMNLRDFYEKQKGWSAGPHLFVDDTGGRCVIGMTPLDCRGVHAVSFNRRAIGIEVLGDYDEEDPKTGRGLAAWQNAAAVTKKLLQWLGLPANEKTVLFHREDPETSKTCPGRLVTKPWVLGLITAA